MNGAGVLAFLGFLALHGGGPAPRNTAPSTDLKGVYVRGVTAARPDFGAFLDKVAAHGLNAIVLDAKDYDGLLTYKSKVPLAVATGATAHAHLASLAEPIRGAHARGLRVIVRVSCFEDELMAKARPALSVQSKAGRPYPIGWLDPSNPEAQAYVAALVTEVMAAGADEVQLDYVRYPVLGIKNADFHLEERGLTRPLVIRDFVRRIHGLTLRRGVPLSLDIFGVVAFGKRADIESLGQDPALLASECEALSPMVYPSHYTEGFGGYDDPGEHPELVGTALRALEGALEENAPRDGRPRAVLRPWLQAMAYRSEGFSSSYVAKEVSSAQGAGASGWLMWSPAQTYGAVFGALPVRATASVERRVASAVPPRPKPRKR